METAVQMSEKKVESPYRELCNLVHVEPYNDSITLNQFLDTRDLANRDLNERLAAALQVLLGLTTAELNPIERVDKSLIDHYIAKIDGLISLQMDEILHHEAFQEVESLWQSCKYVVDRTDFNANTKIELLDLTKEELIEDFEESSETSQSGLYKQIYEREYDTPGGEPFTAIISPFEFDSGARDLQLLKQLSHIAAVAHCPFIGTVSANFFKKGSIAQVSDIEDLASHLERADYIRWNSFRDSEDSRYIGLTLPKFLLRLPYGENNPVSKLVDEKSFSGLA